MKKIILSVIFLLISSEVFAEPLPQPRPSFKQGYARNAFESRAPHLWRGKVGHWAPNLGCTGVNEIRDVSGMGRHGTTAGSMTIDDWVIGRNGFALDFDGSNDYIAGNHSNLTGTGSYTATCWFKLANTTQDSGVAYFVTQWSGDGAGNPHIMFNFTDIIYFRHRDSAYATQGYSFDTNGGIGTTWHHAASVFNGSTIQGYIDGVPVGSAVSANPPRTDTNVWEMGARSSGTEGRLTGQLDDVRIYNRALSAAEIWEMYTKPLSDLELRRPVISHPPVIPPPSGEGKALHNYSIIISKYFKGFTFLGTKE
jgi:hypothetical protein